MIRLLKTFSVAFWVTLCASTAMAEQLVDIYRAEVLVSSQAAAERNTAARKGLRDVLVRVSGDTAVPEQASMKRAINQAQNYLHEFSYASTDRTLEVEGNAVPATLLILKFSPQGIERLLRDARLPLWPASRPKLLVWSLFQDTAGAQHRVPEEAVLTALKDHAALRGLPLTLPHQDFEDNIALPSASLWSLEEDTIKQASERYKPDAILVGRYSQMNNQQWQANWQLFHSSGNSAFSDKASNAETLFARAVDHAADNFARVYAIVPRETGPDVVVMRVENVSDFGSYKNLQRYLEGLAMVKRLELMEAEGHRHLLRLHIEGDKALLLTTLELGKKLFPLALESVQPVRVIPARENLDALENGLPGRPTLEQPAFEPLTPAQPGSFGNPLNYRWQP